MSDSRGSFTLSQTRIPAEQWQEFDEAIAHDFIVTIIKGVSPLILSSGKDNLEIAEKNLLITNQSTQINPY